MVIWEVGDDEKVIEGLDEFGNPDPAYAAALGLVRAPFGRRALAAVIDLVVYLVLQVPYWVFTLPLLLKLYLGRISLYGFVNHPSFVLALVMAGISFVLTLAFCIVQLVLHGRKGVTIGKGLMGIRSVNVKTLERPGFWRMVLRAVVLLASGLLVIGLVLFCLSPLFDPAKRGRGWHDLVGQNWYVDVRKGLQPYDEKRMRIARKMVTAEPVAAQKAMPSLATPAAQGGPGEYRPGGRVSAGVLGVARPHGAGPRPEVGLSGVEEAPAPAQAPQSAPGRPVVGGYRPAAQDGPAGANAHAQDRADLSSGSAAPPAPSPQPTYQPPAPAVPEIPQPHPTGTSGGMVTGTPWGAPPGRSASPAEPVPAQQGPPVRPENAPEPLPAEVAQTRMQAPGYVLYLDDGNQVPLTEAVVLGRDPAQNHPAGRAVPVADQTRSVSKTHLALTPTEGGIEVTDLGSTNGTAVVHDGAERTLEPGIPVLALTGDTVRFGERTAVVGHS